MRKSGNRLRVTALVPGYAPAYIEHSDLYIHTLMNDASGLGSAGVTQQDIDGAMAHAIGDYNAAVEHASNPAQRHGAELDRTYITGKWRGLSRQSEQVINTPGCVQSNWPATLMRMPTGPPRSPPSCTGAPAVRPGISKPHRYSLRKSRRPALFGHRFHQ